MTHIKRALVFVLAGAIFGEIIATIVAPGMITWWNTPGSGSGAAQMICDFPVVVHRTIDTLIRAQLIGAGSGAVIFLILGILINRGMARRAQKKAAASATR